MENPDLQALWSVAEKLARSRAGASAVFEPIGLILLEPGRDSRYLNTPPRAHVFATTGGDGVHFSLVEVETPVGVTSPVVMTVPMAFDAPNHVVGASLRDFLSLGCRFGYFALEQLAYHWEDTIEEIEQAGTESKAPAERRLLAELRRRLRLEPWQHVGRRLAELKLRYHAGALA